MSRAMSLPSFRVTRGALVALFVLALATVPVVLLTGGWNDAQPRDAVVLELAKGRLLLRTYGKEVAAALAPCPAECVYFAVFSLLFTPAATLAVTAARRLAGGAERGLARRLLQAVALLAAAYVLMGAWFTFASGVPACLRWMARLFAVNAVYALPFVTLAAALRALAPSAVAAVSAHCVALGLLGATQMIARFQGSSLADHLPLAVDGLLLSGRDAALARGAGVAVAWTVFFGAIAVFGSFPAKEENSR